MRASLNWLKQYIDINLPANELAERLTMVGLEVESIEYLGDKYRKFVVGEVLETSKHPNATKLTLCKVNIGKEVLQIVCGAPNVAPAQKVAVGLIGAQVPRNQHDPGGAPFVLSHVKLRGEDSYGMICSEYELELGDDKEEILILDLHAKPGTPLADYLGCNDTVFEIGITPNRSDAMSHIGIAREIAALLGKRIKIPKVKLRESKILAIKHASVRIEESIACPRYTARLLRGVKIGQSPKWLQNYLVALNIRPVNNVVDVTSYVLMETGHPLHAFDYDKISGHTVLVKNAREGEKFTTLDHKERTMTASMLMICDAEKPLAIAGVMGGQYSEISPETRNILIESAYFNPASVRKTSKKLGLSTDASQRFERGADPDATVWSVNRAAQLIQEICGGEILKGVIDNYPKRILPKSVTLRTSKTNEILGTTLSSITISKLLGRLEIKHSTSQGKKSNPEKIVFSVPTFRNDIEREIDLIEEVARLHGYNNIETKTRAALEFSKRTFTLEHTEVITQHFLGSGFREIICNSMQEIAVASIASNKYVAITNPISNEMSALRTSLIPGALQVIKSNIFHGTKNLRLFEVGTVYFHDLSSSTPMYIKGYVEEERILLVMTGSAVPSSWDKKSPFYDIYDAKGEIDALFKKIFLDKYKFIPYSNSNALTEPGLHVEINGEVAGTIGKIQKQLLHRYEIEQDVYVVEISTGVLKKNFGVNSKFKVLSKYPPVMRDLAFIVSTSVTVEQIEKEIHKAGGQMLKNIELFDIYVGDQIAHGKKSAAFALEFMSEEHTLKQEEVDHVIQQIVHAVSTTFNASLRG